MEEITLAMVDEEAKAVVEGGEFGTDGGGDLSVCGKAGGVNAGEG